MPGPSLPLRDETDPLSERRAITPPASDGRIMADDPAQQRGSKRARRPTARASSSSTANVGESATPLPTVAEEVLVEADRVIEALHELRLIPTSRKPDRRSIAYAVAELRGQLTTGRIEQAALFGLHRTKLATVRATWVEDEHTRLEQALRFLAPSDQQLLEREARKRQRQETGATLCPRLKR